MRNSRSTVILYSLIGTAVALGFFGHGVLGAKGEEKFVDLVTGTYDKVLGGTMSTETATSIVNVIGWVDITLAAAFVALVIGAIRRKAFAYSAVAMGLFAWAATWGFLTALSRFTAVLNGAEVWDVVERGPNYLAPAALVYLIYRVRKVEAEPPLAMAAPSTLAQVDGQHARPERALTGTR
jgi:hypothetical protein